MTLATVPVEMSAASGAVLTAAEWNSNVRDAVNFIINRPICEVRQTSPQSVANGNTTVGVAFDTEDIDNDGMHSTVTNTSRITAQTAGRFRVSGGVGWAAGSTNRRGCWWMVNGTANNGSETIGQASAANSTSNCARSKSIFLNVGDYAELLPFQDSGVSTNTSGTTFEQPNACVHWIGTT